MPPQSPVTKCTCECIGLKLTGLSRHSCLICLAPVTASHEENSLSSNSSTGFLFSTAIQTNVISQWNTYGDSNSNWVICIAPPTEDWGCITIISLFSTFLVLFHLKCDSKQKKSNRTKISKIIITTDQFFYSKVATQSTQDIQHGHYYGGTCIYICLCLALLQQASAWCSYAKNDTSKSTLHRPHTNILIRSDSWPHENTAPIIPLSLYYRAAA